MEHQEVLERVIRFLGELPRSQGKTIDGTTPLSETVLVDSLTMLQVILFLESEFDLRLERGDLDHIDTPAHIADLVVAQNGQQG